MTTDGKFEVYSDGTKKRCGKPLPERPGRGRHKYCEDTQCLSAAQREQWSDDAKNLREMRRDLLGDDRFRAAQNLEKWLYRKGEIKRRYFLQQMFNVLVAEYLAKTPSSAVLYEEHLLQDVVKGWRLFSDGKLVEANALARTLLVVLKKRPPSSAARITLACQELLTDTASDTCAPVAVTCRRLGQACESLLKGWADAGKDPLRFVSALLRYANYLRAYPWVRHDSHSLALALFDAADRFCQVADPHDLRWLMLRREAVHRNFQLFTVAGNLRKAERELRLISDLSEAIATPAALVHNLEIQATHFGSTGHSDKAHECLDAAWSKAAGASLSPWTRFSLLRADIDHCLKVGLQDRAHQGTCHFGELLIPCPYPYQQTQWIGWLPFRPQLGETYQMIAALPLLADFYIADL